MTIRAPLWLALLPILALASPAWSLDGLRPGMKAPPLTLESLEGGRVIDAGAPQARALLVVFWATWSGKSAEVLERVERLWRSHRAQGLAVLGINVEAQRPSAEDLARAKGVVSRLGLSFPIASDRGLTAFHDYGVVAVPSSVLVGADGTVLATLASYPIAGREEFFDLVEATVRGTSTARAAVTAGPAPNPRAVRYYHLARSMMGRGQGQQADANLKKAIEADPGFVLPRILLGQLYRERALTRESIQVPGATVATVRRSEDEEARWLREAEQQLAEAVRVEPANPAALTELARVHVARGDVAKARQLVERALAVDGAYPPARGQLGALLLASGETERGRAELGSAMDANPLDWRLHITAAEAYEGKGFLKEAADAYRRGVEILWQSRGEAAVNGR